MPHQQESKSASASAASSDLAEISQVVQVSDAAVSSDSSSGLDDTETSRLSNSATSPSSSRGSSSSIATEADPESTQDKRTTKSKSKKSKEVNFRGQTDTPAEALATTSTSVHIREPRSEPEPEPDPLEEYFVQQAKLFRHLERRYVKFQTKSREEQARIKNNRAKFKNNRLNLPPVTSEISSVSIAASSEQSDSDSDFSDRSKVGTDRMIGSSVTTRGVNAIVRPAISLTRAPSAAPSAPFSTSNAFSARAQALKKKKKRVVNPDAMSAIEAATVLRSLEIANPTSSYSLTLSTKSAKSALPIRGHFQLPADPRRSSEIILVFAEPNSPSSTLAKQAGAAHVGGDELFEAVLSGRVSPTRCLATPGMMPSVTRALARYLGPKGLMPVAKRGLVGEGEELAQKIREAAGRMEYRADKQGLVRIPVANMAFEVPTIENNIRSFIQIVREDQSAGSSDDAVTAAAKKKKKGSAITAVRLETTNGPSIELNDVL